MSSSTQNSSGCECSHPGWCVRHQCVKTSHWLGLCQSRSDYFQLWEEGRGPGQPCERDRIGPDQPSALQKAWNLTESLGAFIVDGLKTVTSIQYQMRLEICDKCEHRRGSRCSLCGCYISLKARARVMQCPADKWPHESEADCIYDSTSLDNVPSQPPT